MGDTHMISNRRVTTRAISPLLVALNVVVLLLGAPAPARASFLPPELEDKLATGIALFVLFIVPAVLIVLFWMVHVLPEKIAHKRHHPQFEAIRTLCLLSLVFGGLLWPIAWIWAYSKPVMYKLAYGTDKSPDAPHGGAHEDVQPPAVAPLRARVAQLEMRGIPESDLHVLRADIEALEAKFAGDGAR